MTTPPWTIDQILQFHCPAQTSWSPDGTTMAFLWQGAGEEELRLLSPDSGAVRKLPPLPPPPGSKMWGAVQSGYVWCPDSQGLLRVSDGIWLYDLRTGEQKRLTPGGQAESSPSWSPGGRYLAFRQGDLVAFYDAATGSILLFPMPGPVYAFAPHLAWSPDGTHVAVAFRRAAGRGLDVGVIAPFRHSERSEESLSDKAETLRFAQGDTAREESSSCGAETLRFAQGDRVCGSNLVWATDTLGTVANPQWVDDERLLFTRYNETFTIAEHVLANVITRAEQVVAVEHEPKGLLQGDVEGLDSHRLVLSPDSREAIMLRRVKGWYHLHLLDLRTGEIRQLCFGECEDSSPVWSPDGRYVAYLSNGHPSLASLNVWIWDKETGQSRPLAAMPGAKAELAWSLDGRRISFLHAGSGEPPGIWLGQIDDLTCSRLALDGPPESVRAHDVPPQEIWTEASDGCRTPGLLYTRPEIRGRPAIIWLHGGPGMQYYAGWPIDYGSCMQHVFFQSLVQEGYTVLYLNYRGSTGYGGEHEQGNFLQIGVAEVADIAGAVRYLGLLPQVDANRLCLAGRSYGGFAALAALTRLPGLFRLGIVIAGTGDISGSLGPDSDFWDDAAYYGWRSGWLREQHPEAWRAATVLPDLDKLQAPLLILHGTQDQAVPIEEAYKVERRCRELGKPCQARYYEGEDHVFSRADTWCDVFQNIKCQISNLK